MCREWLKAKRKELGLTRDDMGMLLGLEEKSYCYYERRTGKTLNISLRMACRLSKILGMSLEEIAKAEGFI